MFACLQQAVLGFDGDEFWGKELDRINDGEVNVQRPACEEDQLIDLQPGHSSTEPRLYSQLVTRLRRSVAAGPSAADEAEAGGGGDGGGA